VIGLGLTDERLSPSHSWRHRFKTMSIDIANAITGHHRKTVAEIRDLLVLVAEEQLQQDLQLDASKNLANSLPF